MEVGKDANALVLHRASTQCGPFGLVGIVGIMSCWLNAPDDMSATDMPTCQQHVMRRVGNMSNVMTCPRWHRKNLSWCDSIALALQMLCHKICQHMTKIDSQSRCWWNVGCYPKQGDREWREDMPADMSLTFPTKPFGVDKYQELHQTSCYFLATLKANCHLVCIEMGQLVYDISNLCPFKFGTLNFNGITL
jgi:hypothetical protein